MIDTNDLFQPDTILPAQFYDRSGAAHTPEKALRLAVLEDALRTIQRRPRPTDTPRARMAYNEALAWLLMPGSHDWAFTMDDICDDLGIDAGAIRAKVRAGDVGRMGRRLPPPRAMEPGVDRHRWRVRTR